MNEHENEIRYYLALIQKAMTPVSEEEQQNIDSGEIPDRAPFEPQYIVTAVKLPNGAIEIAVNNSNILDKIGYILEAYDDNMCLKTNAAVVLQNLLVV